MILVIIWSAEFLGWGWVQNCHFSLCYIYTPISKNVVVDNGEWPLSNGNCTTERNCGFHNWYAKTMSSSLGAKLGSSSNHDDDGNRNPKNLHIWHWKIVFCTLYTCIFHLLTFWRRSRSFYDVKWPFLQLCGWREHMMTNVQLCLVPSDGCNVILG